jgi:2,5-diketo-D-gluconate reductase A
VTLRWIRDQEIVAIPRSSSPERRRLNAELDQLVLDDQDRALLASLDLGEDAAWDSREHEEW